MRGTDGFYTLKGYTILEGNAITSSMEDYLEIIYRIRSANEAVRISAISEMLHVKPSSASKMVDNLKKQDLVSSKKYGYITLTDMGVETQLRIQPDAEHGFDYAWRDTPEEFGLVTEFLRKTL